MRISFIRVGTLLSGSFKLVWSAISLKSALLGSISNRPTSYVSLPLETFALAFSHGIVGLSKFPRKFREVFGGELGFSPSGATKFFLLVESFVKERKCGVLPCRPPTKGKPVEEVVIQLPGSVRRANDFELLVQTHLGPEGQSSCFNSL